MAGILLVDNQIAEDIRLVDRLQEEDSHRDTAGSSVEWDSRLGSLGREGWGPVQPLWCRLLSKVSKVEAAATWRLAFHQRPS